MRDVQIGRVNWPSRNQPAIQVLAKTLYLTVPMCVAVFLQSFMKAVACASQLKFIKLW